MLNSEKKKQALYNSSKDTNLIHESSTFMTASNSNYHPKVPLPPYYHIEV